jgi:hypothetical protein
LSWTDTLLLHRHIRTKFGREKVPMAFYAHWNFRLRVNYNMKNNKVHLGFVDSDERLTKLSSLLEIVEAKHVDDVRISRAKATVDAIIMLETINYDVMDAVVKSLAQSSDYSLDVFDAHELAFDILCDLPLSHGSIQSLEAHLPLSPIGEIVPRKTDYAPMVDDPENVDPIPAFDNTLVTGDVKYGGDGHRCVAIARECLARGLWDGQSKFHVCGDVSDMHKRMMFNNHNPYICGLSRYPGQTFCYMNLNDLPHDAHITVPPFAAADDDTQELPELKADDAICVHCSLFTATHGNLCSVCVDLQEVDNGD